MNFIEEILKKSKDISQKQLAALGEMDDSIEKFKADPMKYSRSIIHRDYLKPLSELDVQLDDSLGFLYVRSKFTTPSNKIKLHIPLANVDEHGLIIANIINQLNLPNVIHIKILNPQFAKKNIRGC